MLIDFKKTKTKKKELETALKVIHEFKKCESTQEWMMEMFVTWQKLELLEEYLVELTGYEKV